MIPQTDGQNRPATLGRRLLAKMADMLVINSTQILILMLCPVLQAMGMSGSLLLYWAIILCVVSHIGYFAFFWSHGRQTLGYRLAGLQVVSADGTHRTIGMAR